MKKFPNYDEIETAKEFKRLPAGGYIIKILDAEDIADKEYFKIIYDIAEGEYKDYFKDDFYSDKDYAHQLIISYSEKAAKNFKAFVTSIQTSNDILIADKVKAGTLTGKDLKGKQVGAVLYYEEYEGDNGEIKTRLSKFARIRSAESIRSGSYKVPATKPLKGAKSTDSEAFAPTSTENPFAGFTPELDSELPF